MEREVSGLLQRALKNCPADIPGDRQPIYQFRAGKLYFRLASLYHNSYQEARDESRRIPYNLAVQNYKKALKLFVTLEEPVSGLEAFLHYIKILEPSSTGRLIILMKRKYNLIKI